MTHSHNSSLLTSDDIQTDEDSTYEFITDPDGIRLSLEIAGCEDMVDEVGHLLAESSDGHLYGLWYSTDREPSDDSLYQELM